jgi:hypothetical protein
MSVTCHRLNGTHILQSLSLMTGSPRERKTLALQGSQLDPPQITQKNTKDTIMFTKIVVIRT